MRIRRALLSVTDKSGLSELAEFLRAEGVELIASGGTRRHLESAGIPCLELAAYTGSPECLEGRVKTLHPKIFGGILADPEVHAAELARMDLPLIDLLVVNLYRFREAVAGAGGERAVIEAIDIGGPSLLRAGAKNHRRVTVLCRPGDYQEFMAAWRAGDGDPGLAFRRRMAAAAFGHTRDYDRDIAGYFGEGGAGAPDLPAIGRVIQKLRYGENPHQGGALHAWLAQEPPFAQLGGAELSYNNFLDLAAALDLLLDLTEPAAVVIKHGNPCGVACGENALALAWEGDPVSAYGSVVALNRPAAAADAAFLADKFVELFAAPAYAAEARARLAAKKKLRLLAVPSLDAWQAAWRLRSIGPLVLIQDQDTGFAPPEAWRHAAGPAADASTLRELDRAWRVVKHVKSNAIVVWKGSQLLGAGAGQTSRVDSCRIAVSKAREHGHEVAGAVAASDAFFPFPDGLELLAAAGVKAVAQPGGSLRDEAVIARAQELGVTLMLTGRRHFRH